MFQLKYRNKKEVGFYLGKQLGHLLQNTERFSDVDALVPLPLDPKKERKRGYNQAAVICQGISSVWKNPVLKVVVVRTIFTDTQTKQYRVHRWQNLQNDFAVADKNAIDGKHILLVDDVITTDATLEACGAVILNAGSAKLSIAAIAWTI
jgi:ComF family protein